MGRRIIPRKSNGRFARPPVIACKICQACGAINLPQYAEHNGFMRKEYSTTCHNCNAQLVTTNQRSEDNHA